MAKAMHIIDELERSAMLHADRMALISPEISVTYEELTAAISSLAAALQSHTSVERIFLQTDTSYGSVVAYFACLKAERVPLLGDPSWPLNYVEKQFDLLGLECALFPVRSEKGTTLDGAREVPFSEDRLDFSLQLVSGNGRVVALQPDTEVIRFTSGSTGVAKALEFSGRAVTEAAKAWRTAAGYNVNTRALCVATMNNGLAFNTSLLPVLGAGGCLICYPRPLIPGALCKYGLSHAANVFVGFPFAYDLLCEAKSSHVSEFLQSVDLLVSAAAVLEPDTNQKIYKLAGKWIGNYYGLAEAGPVTFNDGSQASSLGVSLPNCEIKLEQPDDSEGGRLLVKTESMATCSHGTDSETFSADWCITNDRCHIGPDGQLYLLGRFDSVVNIGGNKVDLSWLRKEIETLVSLGACSVGITDSGQLELVVEGEEMDTVTLTQSMRASLPAHCVPSKIRFTGKMARAASGKILAPVAQESLE